MKNLHKIVLALCVAGLLAFAYGCVTPQDTENLAASHAALMAKLEALRADQAAGVVTEERARELAEQAVEEFKQEANAVGQDVTQRTAGLWGAITQDPMGGGLVLLLSQLPGLLGLSAYRNRTRKKDPAVANALRKDGHAS